MTDLAGASAPDERPGAGPAGIAQPAPRRRAGWRLERRADPRNITLYRVSAVALGLVVSLLVAPLFSGASSGQFYNIFWTGTLGTSIGIGNTLTIAVPLILAGLAASIPYRLRLWNVGIDGQIMFGAWAASWIAFQMPHASGPVLIVVMLIFSLIGGALWIVIPTLARVYLRVSEIITTFLLNFVAVAWITYWAQGPWQDPTSSSGIRAKPLPIQSGLALVDISGVYVSWGIFIALALPVVLWLLHRFTRWGYEVSIIGANPRAGGYARMRVRRTLIASMLIGGALAGLAGAVNMMGTTQQLSPDLTANTGFNGLIIAVLAAGSEVTVLAIALIYAVLLSGGLAVGVIGVSSDLSFAIIGFTLILGATGEAVARLRVVRTRPPTDADAAAAIPAPATNESVKA